MGLFKQAKQAPSPTDTLKRLREVLDTLEKREAFLGTRVIAEREKAKKLATTNKKGASFITTTDPLVAVSFVIVRYAGIALVFVQKREFFPSPALLPSNGRFRPSIAQRR